MHAPASAKPPLRLPPLPRPGRPLFERRRNRPNDTATALISAFDHAVQRAELDVLIVTDEAGILVSASTTELRSIKVLGETLFVGALGGNFGPRERELATSAVATRRILMS